jgi:predicted phosphoribosyltransferase
MPENFFGVGQFYDDFSQVTDEEVAHLIRRAEHCSVQEAV